MNNVCRALAVRFCASAGFSPAMARRVGLSDSSGCLCSFGTCNTNRNVGRRDCFVGVSFSLLGIGLAGPAYFATVLDKASIANSAMGVNRCDTRRVEGNTAPIPFSVSLRGYIHIAGVRAGLISAGINARGKRLLNGALANGSTTGKINMLVRNLTADGGPLVALGPGSSGSICGSCSPENGSSAAKKICPSRSANVACPLRFRTALRRSKAVPVRTNRFGTADAFRMACPWWIRHATVV